MKRRDLFRGSTLLLGICLHRSIEASAPMEPRILTREQVLAQLSGYPALRSAIARSASTLDELREGLARRPGRHLSRFIAVFAIEQDGQVLPRGVEIDSFDGQLIKGRWFDNQVTYAPQERSVTVRASQVIDWYYFLGAEMIGGNVYKCCYERYDSLSTDSFDRAHPKKVLCSSPEVLECHRELARALLLEDWQAFEAAREQCELSRDAKFLVPEEPPEFDDYGGRIAGGEWQTFATKYCSRSFFERLQKSGYITTDPKELEENLRIACRQGNLDVVGLLLDQGVDINSRAYTLHTPLCVAASFGRDAVAIELVRRGADVTLTDNGGRSPLHDANTLALCEALVNAGADVNAVNDSGYSVLQQQRGRKNGWENIPYLVARGAKAPPWAQELIDNPKEFHRKRLERELEVSRSFGPDLDEDYDFGAVLPIRSLWPLDPQLW